MVGIPILRSTGAMRNLGTQGRTPRCWRQPSLRRTRQVDRRAAVLDATGSRRRSETGRAAGSRWQGVLLFNDPRRLAERVRSPTCTPTSAMRHSRRLTGLPVPDRREIHDHLRRGEHLPAGMREPAASTHSEGPTPRCSASDRVTSAKRSRRSCSRCPACPGTRRWPTLRPFCGLSTCRRQKVPRVDRLRGRLPRLPTGKLYKHRDCACSTAHAHGRSARQARGSW